MLYVDTSVLVAALSNEVASTGAQTWLAAQDPARLTISDWTVTEFSSAMSIKVRSGELLPEHRAATAAAFQLMIADSLTILSIDRAHFLEAARFLNDHALGLRSGDALHLAVASFNGATVHTLDKRMANAGLALGIPIQLS